MSENTDFFAKIKIMDEADLQALVLELTVEESRLFLTESTFRSDYSDERMAVHAQHRDASFQRREAALQLYERWRRKQVEVGADGAKKLPKDT
jgi:hypothetical protein